MSTTTQDIPQEVATHSGIRSYRFADGEIRSGRDEDGTLESYKQVVGRLVRVGIHQGETDDGRTYVRPEADIQTSDGMASIGITIFEHATVSAVTFLQGLLCIPKGEIAVFEANRSKKPNKYGKFSTYANLFIYDPITQKSARVGPTEHDFDTPMETKFQQLCDALKEHTAYAERPKRDEDGGPWDELAKMATKSGWPDYYKNQESYLAWLATVLKREIGCPGDVTDVEWSSTAEKIEVAKSVPKALTELVAKNAKSAADEYDPFAEE
jgi:hypothetical protein